MKQTLNEIQKSSDPVMKTLIVGYVVPHWIYAVHEDFILSAFFVVMGILWIVTSMEDSRK